MVQKATALGNCWLASLSWQHTSSCITSCAEFFGKTSNHPGDSAPLQPRFGALWLLAFPKTKLPLKGKRFQTVWWDSGKHIMVDDGNWENCVKSQGAHYEGDWGVIVLCTIFLVLCIFLNSCLYFFNIRWLDTFQTDLVCICLCIFSLSFNSKCKGKKH